MDAAQQLTFFMLLNVLYVPSILCHLHCLTVYLRHYLLMLSIVDVLLIDHSLEFVSSEWHSTALRSHGLLPHHVQLLEVLLLLRGGVRQSKPPLPSDQIVMHLLHLLLLSGLGQTSSSWPHFLLDSDNLLLRGVTP